MVQSHVESLFNVSWPNFITTSILPNIPGFLQSYKDQIAFILLFLKTSFAQIILYLTAFPFIFRYILIPYIRKAVTWYKHQSRWEKKTFRNQVTCTLCILKPQSNGKNLLKLRTLFDKDVREIIYRNQKATKVLLEAASRTKEDFSWLVLDKNHAWMIFKAILNYISELFAIEFLADDFEDVPVKSEWYIFGITFSKDKKVEVNKLRIFLMKEKTLLSLNENTPCEFENEKHKLTFQSMLKASAMLKKHKNMDVKADERFGDFEQSFHRISLSLRCKV